VADNEGNRSFPARAHMVAAAIATAFSRRSQISRNSNSGVVYIRPFFSWQEIVSLAAAGGTSLIILPVEQFINFKGWLPVGRGKSRPPFQTRFFGCVILFMAFRRGGMFEGSPDYCLGNAALSASTAGGSLIYSPSMVSKRGWVVFWRGLFCSTISKVGILSGIRLLPFCQALV